MKLKFVSILHGKGKEEHEKWGADLTKNELLQKVNELPGTPIFVEHDTENGGKYESKNQVGTVISARIDKETDGLQIVGEIDTSKFKGYDAWKKLKNGGLIGTSLTHETIFSFHPDFDIVGKPIVEVSLTSDPIRKEALVTHIEKESDEFIESKQKLKQLLIDEKLKRKQYNQSQSDQRLNSIPLKIPKIRAPTMSELTSQQPSAQTQFVPQASAPPQSQSQPQTAIPSTSQPQSQPFPQAFQEILKSRPDLDEAALREALEIRDKTKNLEKKQQEEFSKETLDMLEEASGFITSVIQSIPDNDDKLRVLKTGKFADKFVEEAKNDPFGMGEFVRLMTKCSTAFKQSYQKQNEDGKLIEAQKNHYENAMKSKEEEHNKKMAEIENQFKRQLEESKRAAAHEVERAKLGSQSFSNSTSQSVQGLPFNDRYDPKPKVSTQEQSGGPKFVKTTEIPLVVPKGVPPPDPRYTTPEVKKTLSLFSDYESKQSWKEDLNGYKLLDMSDKPQ